MSSLILAEKVKISDPNSDKSIEFYQVGERLFASISERSMQHSRPIDVSALFYAVMSVLDHDAVRQYMPKYRPDGSMVLYHSATGYYKGRYGNVTTYINTDWEFKAQFIDSEGRYDVDPNDIEVSEDQEKIVTTIITSKGISKSKPVTAAQYLSEEEHWRHIERVHLLEGEVEAERAKRLKAYERPKVKVKTRKREQAKPAEPEKALLASLRSKLSHNGSKPGKVEGARGASSESGSGSGTSSKEGPRKTTGTDSSVGRSTGGVQRPNSGRNVRVKPRGRRHHKGTYNSLRPLGVGTGGSDGEVCSEGDPFGDPYGGVVIRPDGIEGYIKG